MNLLITGAWEGAKEHFATIESMGNQVRFLQYEKEEPPCDPDWIEGIICNGFFLHHNINHFPNLRFIQLTSAGFDRVPMEIVKNRRIEVFNAKDVYSIPMAEFAVAGVLTLLKDIREFHQNQRAHGWEKRRGLGELYGKHVVIIGCGNLGSACAERFHAFGCNVIGINRTVKTIPFFDRVRPMSAMNEELVRADILIISVPLDSDTWHLIGEKQFGIMKKNGTTILVNLARGSIIDEGKMIEALPELGGAVLDVFEEEPLARESLLWNMENVLITPHNSFVSTVNSDRLKTIILQDIQCYCNKVYT